MMISDLPRHLLEEILSRVPATTLRHLRPTCKQWNALLKDQTFTEKHHRKAPKQPLLVMLKEFRVCPVSIKIDLSVAAPSIEFKEPFDLKGSQQVIIIEVFHCEGLLLCVTKYNKLVVWNPLLGETKWVQASSRHYKKESSFALGYKNDNKSCRDYKILRYWQSYKREDQVVEFEIYEFITDSWRFLDEVSLDYYIHQGPCVSFQGNTYWVASHRKEDDSIFLLSFDFTTERFRRLNLPPVPRNMMLSLVREEEISVLHMSLFPLKMEVWVTNDFGGSEAADLLLWSKSFTLDLHVLEERYPMFPAFLLDEEKKVVVCPGVSSWDSKNVVYIIGEDDEYHTEIPYGNSTQKSWRPRIFNYVPSLVQIQQCRDKRQE